MVQFYIKQKFWSWGGKFFVKDQQDQPHYEVTGSVLKWLKEFQITDLAGRDVAHIKKEWTWFLPRFTIRLSTGEAFYLQKEFTWFRPKYHIEGLDMVVQGDFWDMDFTLVKDGQIVATINQEWFRMTSTYQVTVHEEKYSDLVIALVIAIDYVKEMEAAAARSGAN